MLRSTTGYGSPTAPFPERPSGHSVPPPANYPVHKYPRHLTYRAFPPRFTYYHLFRDCKRLIDFTKPQPERNPPMPRYWRHGYIPKVYTLTWDPHMRLTGYNMLLRWVRTQPIDKEKGILHWLWEAKKAGADPGIVEFDWVASGGSGRYWEELKQWLVERIEVERALLKQQDLGTDEDADFEESSGGSQVSKSEDVGMDQDREDIWDDFAGPCNNSVNDSSPVKDSKLREIDDVNELDVLDWKEFVQYSYSQKRTGVGYDLDLKARLDQVAVCQLYDDGDGTDDFTTD